MGFIGLKNSQLIEIVTSISFTSFTQISLFIYFLIYPSHVIYINVSKIFLANKFKMISFFYSTGT